MDLKRWYITDLCMLRIIAELEAKNERLRQSLVVAAEEMKELEAENKRLRDALQEIQRVCISPNLVENLATQALKESSDVYTR